MKKVLSFIRKTCFTKREVEHSERFMRNIEILNRFSLVFHFLIALVVVFMVELISRRSFGSAFAFVGAHTMAYLYNAFLVFASLTLVYLFRRRAFFRIIISGFWIILGIINGCVLSNRVTPFGYTDLKCIPELFAMNNTSYFTAEEATMVVTGLGIFAFACAILFVKGPRFTGKIHGFVAPLAILAVLFVGIPVTTSAAQNKNVVASYFSNIAQGYEKYGFVYSFSSSVVDRGMGKPEDYEKETIGAINAAVKNGTKETKVDGKTGPNIICVLLESFVDPDEIKFLNVNEDPIPTFHELEKNFTTGYCTVPVVGAGTANTEFEILTGMSMQYFGTGEYPYKTILKKTDCESIASDLSKIGYGTHVVHNNGGNFYSRANAFSMMGFDTFTSKELMNITKYTPNGSWAADDILVDETIKSLDATPEQADFTYTITVGTHGDYPTEPVIENPVYVATGGTSEEANNQWTYYVNQLHEADRFIANLIKELEKRDEDTILVMFGDHLPTMGLEETDMKSGDIYKTKYITWNNMGLEKKDADLYSYQLLAKVTESVGIHEGTIMNYHQTQCDDNMVMYQAGLENLQYDLLYGERFSYQGENPYPATEIVMGIDEVEITSYFDNELAGKLCINGNNFTKWSKVFVNGEKVPTTYITSHTLTISKEDVAHGDLIVVNQMGSSNTVFRSSNEIVYEDLNAPVSDDSETEEIEEIEEIQEIEVNDEQ